MVSDVAGADMLAATMQGERQIPSDFRLKSCLQDSERFGTLDHRFLVNREPRRREISATADFMLRPFCLCGTHGGDGTFEDSTATREH